MDRKIEWACASAYFSGHKIGGSREVEVPAATCMHHLPPRATAQAEPAQATALVLPPEKAPENAPPVFSCLLLLLLTPYCRLLRLKSRSRLSLMMRGPRGAPASMSRCLLYRLDTRFQLEVHDCGNHPLPLLPPTDVEVKVSFRVRASATAGVSG